MKAKYQNYGISSSHHEAANCHVLARTKLRILDCQTMYVCTYACMCIT